MTSSTAPEPMMFDLVHSKRALTEVRGKLIENAARFQTIPDVNPQFRPLQGDYKRVSDQATLRNEFQLRAGFLDYLYAPEPAK